MTRVRCCWPHPWFSLCLCTSWLPHHKPAASAPGTQRPWERKNRSTARADHRYRTQNSQTEKQNKSVVSTNPFTPTNDQFQISPAPPPEKITSERVEVRKVIFSLTKNRRFMVVQWYELFLNIILGCVFSFQSYSCSGPLWKRTFVCKWTMLYNESGSPWPEMNDSKAAEHARCVRFCTRFQEGRITRNLTGESRNAQFSPFVVDNSRACKSESS